MPNQKYGMNIRIEMNTKKFMLIAVFTSDKLLYPRKMESIKIVSAIHNTPTTPHRPSEISIKKNWSTKAKPFLTSHL